MSLISLSVFVTVFIINSLLIGKYPFLLTCSISTIEVSLLDRKEHESILNQCFIKRSIRIHRYAILFLTTKTKNLTYLLPMEVFDYAKHSRPM